MDCPYCGSASRVIDSRPIPDGVRRRRVCKVCTKRFTTHERLAPAQLKVRKRRGRTMESFQVGKLMASLERVVRGTSLDRSDAERLARRLELELTDEQAQGIYSLEIARRVLERLQDLDELAYERYAVNYREPSGGWTFETGEESLQMGLFDLESDLGDAASDDSGEPG